MKNTYDIALFMKLGYDSTNKYNGLETLEIYEDFCNKNGTTWFSTNAHFSGMAEKRRQEFLKEIKDGNIVEMYFAVSKGSGGENDIVYKGEVLDIKTEKEGLLSPDKLLTPEEWIDSEYKIWVKLKNLKPFDGLSANDFIIASTGNLLSDVITKSQYHFGYIKKK
ncbi:MAG: hypothetical protein GX889_05340 [Clostridiales bacterium]|nr:hypothetical protein [Clostridiales bacterium]